MQEDTTALQTNPVCCSLISPLSLTVQVAAYLLDFSSLLLTASTATLSLICLSLIPCDEFVFYTLRLPVSTQQVTQRQPVNSPVKQTQSLVNKGPPQLLSIETLAKIATETFLFPPPPAPPPSIHLYYLEPWRSVLPWILSSWLQTTTQMYRKWRGTEWMGKLEAIRGLGGSLTSARWKSSCDKSQGL